MSVTDGTNTCYPYKLVVGANSCVGGVSTINGGYSSYWTKTGNNISNNNSGDVIINSLNDGFSNQFEVLDISNQFAFNVNSNNDAINTKFNTLDDGSGNTTIAESLNVNYGNSALSPFTVYDSLGFPAFQVYLGSGNDNVSTKNNVLDDGNGNSVILTSLSVGDYSATSMFNVGTSNQFKVNSTGSISTSGNVGIGTTITNAGAALSVMNGNVGIGTWAPRGALVVMNGNVGIGTTAPDYPIVYDSAVESGLSGIGDRVVIGGVTTTTGGNRTLGIGVAINGLPGHGGWSLNVSDTSSNNAFTANSGAGTTLILQNYGGNVGIGTFDAASPLDVSGGITIGSGYITNTAPVNGLLVQSNVGIASTAPGQALDVQGTIRISKLGSTLSIIPGINSCAGIGTLSSGTVTISTTCTPTTYQGIFLSDGGGGVLANIGSLSVGTVTSGTSFVVNSSNALDSSNFSWEIHKTS